MSFQQQLQLVKRNDGKSWDFIHCHHGQFPRTRNQVFAFTLYYVILGVIYLGSKTELALSSELQIGQVQYLPFQITLLRFDLEITSQGGIVFEGQCSLLARTGTWPWVFSILFLTVPLMCSKTSAKSLHSSVPQFTSRISPRDDMS